jgi:hypothetical protein
MEILLQGKKSQLRCVDGMEVPENSFIRVHQTAEIFMSVTKMIVVRLTLQLPIQDIMNLDFIHVYFGERLYKLKFVQFKAYFCASIPIPGNGSRIPIFLSAHQ